jgi:hypothetical protein
MSSFQAGVPASSEARLPTALPGAQGGTPNSLSRASYEKEEQTMADDLNKRGPQDRSRINVNESWELDYWKAKFGVSAETLRQAVGEAGVMAKDVEAWLAQKGHKKPA